MTKMKSRKMTKSTFAIIIMGIAMVAMLAFGGTFAYFTATTTSTSQSATLAKVILKSDEAATQLTKTNLLPGDVIIANDQITFSNESTVETIVFVTMTTAVTQGQASVVGDVLDITNPQGWSEYEPAEPVAGTKIYYKKVAAIANQETPVAETVAFGATIIVDEDLMDVWSQSAYNTAVTNSQTYISESGFMGASVVVTIRANSVQSQGFVYTDTVATVIGTGTEDNPEVQGHTAGDVDTSKLATAYATAQQTVS